MINEIYRETAIVRDDSLPGGATYELWSPLIKTELRAVKVGERILANLNRYRGLLGGSDDIPRTKEFILDLDSPSEEFYRRLKILGQEWRESEERLK